MIKHCNCAHPGQDELHGKGRRVHNPTKTNKYRCTVCRSEKDGKESKDTEPKKAK